MEPKEDHSGVLWIGTFGGGLNRLAPGKDGSPLSFRHYNQQDGLPNDVICGILEEVPPNDAGSHLWLSTNKGLSRFNPGTGKFTNYSVKEGLQSNEFNVGAFCKTRTGEMFFGGINGFNAFYPEHIGNNPFIPRIVITSFIKFNQTVKLERDISETSELELSYRDSIISFEFAALCFSDPQKDQYKYLFKAFTQVDGSYSRKYGGTGLGLAISKHLVELMGGKIGVESEEGKGTTAWLTLHLKKQPDQVEGKEARTREFKEEPRDKPIPGVDDSKTKQPKTETGNKAAGDRQYKARILLAEDNMINQKLVVRLLENMGYRVDPVTNGLEALKALESVSYDLVLMDIQMPEMDGLEAAKEIRKKEKQHGAYAGRGIPIIAMTAHAMKDHREKCLEAGMDDYLTKPINPTLLYEAITRLLSRDSP